MKVSLDAIDGLLRAPVKKVQATSRERAAANRLAVLRAVAEHGQPRQAPALTRTYATRPRKTVKVG